MNAVRTKVSENGRLSLPAEIRKAVGLERGGPVVIDLDADGAIRVRTIDQVVARAQAIARELLKDHPEAGVDDFLAERRREARREEQEYRRWEQGFRPDRDDE